MTAHEEQDLEARERSGENESQRLQAIGQLLAGISHESRNILTAILSFAQVGQRRQSDPEKMAEILKHIESEALRCMDLHSAVLAQVRTLGSMDASSDTPQPSARLSDVVAKATRLVEHQMGMKRVRLETCDVPADLVVSGSAASLSQVLLNLLLNAMQSTPSGGLVRISVSEDKTTIGILVDDSGPGVPEGDRSSVFERLFTTKPTGTGLGLAISLDLVRAIGGSLAVGESDLGGASFAVTLPRNEDVEGL